MFPYKTLLFMTHGYVKKKHKNAFLKKSLLKIALCTLSSNISAPRKIIIKKCLGCWDAVYVMFLCKTLLFMTLGYVKKKV